MRIDYDTPSDTPTNNTITEKEDLPMLEDIKALTTGEWLYLIVLGTLVIAAYTIAEIMY
jgi:hypothetical protein